MTFVVVPGNMLLGLPFLVSLALPVLLCSGYGDNEEAQGLISLDAKGLLSKPYRIGELSEHLARFGV